MDRPKPHRARRSRLWLGVVAVTAATLAATLGRAADIHVRLESGRIWIRTGGEVAARELLDSITKRTGVEFLIDPELAERPLEVEIEGWDLERAVRQVATQIPQAGGHTMVYVQSASGGARLARVMVFGVGKAPLALPAEAAVDAAESAVVTPPMPPAAIEAPTPSAAVYEAQQQQLIEMGVSPENAQEFVELTREAVRVQKTPGAAEAIMKSERYRKLNYAIAKAQGKFPEAEGTPAR